MDFFLLLLSLICHLIVTVIVLLFLHVFAALLLVALLGVPNGSHNIL